MRSKELLKVTLCIGYITPTGKIVYIDSIGDTGNGYYLKNSNGDELLVSYNNIIIYDYSKYKDKNGRKKFINDYKNEINAIIERDGLSYDDLTNDILTLDNLCKIIDDTMLLEYLSYDIIPGDNTVQKYTVLKDIVLSLVEDICKREETSEK